MRRVDASMSLLVDLTANALDEGYAAAVQRREAAFAEPSPSGAGARLGRPVALMAAIALVAAGGLFATSAVTKHRNAAAAAKTRTALLRQIDDKTAATNGLEDHAQQLHAEVTKARDDALSASGRGAQLRAQIATLEAVDGGTPVIGPGIEVVLDNAESTGNAHEDSLGTIYDRDIQAVVNALFATGAEAIAVNGQRLTTQTAIREAGSAILVDYRPLSPPYRIDAVGPPGLAQAFLHTQTGTLYQTWQQVYGLGFSVEERTHLELASAGNLVIHYADPLESP